MDTTVRRFNFEIVKKRLQHKHNTNQDQQWQMRVASHFSPQPQICCVQCLCPVCPLTTHALFKHTSFQRCLLIFYFHSQEFLGLSVSWILMFWISQGFPHLLSENTLIDTCEIINNPHWRTVVIYCRNVLLKSAHWNKSPKRTYICIEHKLMHFAYVKYYLVVITTTYFF